MQAIKKMFNFKPATSGELLFKQVANQFIPKEMIQQFINLGNMLVGNRQEDFAEYYVGVYCFNLTTRLIQKAKNIIEDAAIPQVKQLDYMRTYIQAELEVASTSSNKQELIKLASLSIMAASNSGKDISPSTKKQVVPPSLGYVYCYICGVSLEKDQIQYEHVWPRSFGGNSIADNLLPACMECNNKKDSMLLWQDAHIFSFVLGPSPSIGEFTRIQKREKIALHRRKIFREACVHQITLKESALKIGTMNPVTTIYQNDAVDFFNCVV